MQDLWAPIEEFPDYLINTQGIVVNRHTNQVRTASLNQQGVPMVTLFKGGLHTTRSVGILVARTFIPEDRPRFDTVIYLDGDRSGHRVDNMLWRPRPFAIQYHKQFHLREGEFLRNTTSVIEIRTNTWFERISEAAMRYGLIATQILNSCRTSQPVFPTAQIFQIAAM